MILVQTKRAAGEQKVAVNYRGQINVQQATQLPEFLNAYEYALLYNRAVENSGTGTAYTPEQLDMIRNHSNPNVYGDSDLMDYLDNVGYTTTHSVSVNGGNNFVKYYISGGYTHSKGLYSGVGRDRFNYSAKLDATLVKGLVLSLDLIGSRSNNKNTSYTSIDAAYSFSPLQVLAFDNGQLASIDGSNPLVNIYGRPGGAERLSPSLRRNTKAKDCTPKVQNPWQQKIVLSLKVETSNLRGEAHCRVFCL